MNAGLDRDNRREDPLPHVPEHDRTQLESDVVDLIVDSRSAKTKDEANRLLNRARTICNGATLSDNRNIPSLKLELLTEMATNIDSADARHSLWKQALDEGFRLLSTAPDPDLAIKLFRKVVDFSQDPHVSLTAREATSRIAQAKRSIDTLVPTLGPPYHVQLLACKASLLRRMSRYQATRDAEQSTGEAAVRCAKKACELLPQSWDNFLQLGLCHWHMAQYEKYDKPFHQRLEEAEACLWQSAERDTNRINMLALAQYFRNTYQSSPFVKTYEQYSLLQYNKRDHYRTSYLYAEGALQLFYSNHPQTLVDTCLEGADRLLEQTVDAGYADARHIVDLAFLKAARGDVTVGMEVAKLLHPGSKGTSWVHIAETITNKEFDNDLFAKGFALGIDKSSIWNKLGTFAKRFLDDLDLAISMYRTALRLNPANAVAMTNLSSALLQMGTLADTQEAQRWISKAASCADRRFRWWRSVREQVALSLQRFGTGPGETVPKHSTCAHKLADLQKTFHALRSIENPQERGYGLEKLVARLVFLTLGNCRPSYRARMKWSDNSVIQVDAAFCHLGTRFFRVETKWTSSPVNPADVVLFRDKLDVVGVKGLLISMNGFTPEAIAKAANYRDEREILLMDGDELEMTLNGCPSFDEVIRHKQQYFAIESNPYHRVAPTVQEEID